MGWGYKKKKGVLLFGVLVVTMHVFIVVVPYGLWTGSTYILEKRLRFGPKLMI